ncbi:hypothetical protein M0804_013764 [Polistes exclamans]|nr:hypothetical protein M0804_013764 [Polistes exclamans]
MQHVEGLRLRPKAPVTYTEAQPTTIRAMGLNPAVHLVNGSCLDYGGTNDVNALDQRVASQKRACPDPVLSLGSWTNVVELAVSLWLSRYTPHITESRDLINWSELDKPQVAQNKTVNRNRKQPTFDITSITRNPKIESNPRSTLRQLAEMLNQSKSKSTIRDHTAKLGYVNRLEMYGFRTI